MVSSFHNVLESLSVWLSVNKTRVAVVVFEGCKMEWVCHKKKKKNTKVNEKVVSVVARERDLCG